MDERLKLSWQAQEYHYIASPAHRLLGVGHGRFLGSNIGENGENLTIAVLSMNRSALTIRLMDSIKEKIPNFQGEFLVGDNGSTPEEQEKIKKHFEKMPFRCRMLLFGNNYGVAGGRNRLFRQVQTEWLFSLDNDIYFISDPLAKIQEDIGFLGCHFLCMPLLNEKSHEAFVYGGHLSVSVLEQGLNVGGATAYTAPQVEDMGPHDPFLCTFLSGGCSIINKETFFRMQGYDENMFIGFEDTEFSLRLFQSGYKIGACGLVCIIHDHPKPLAKDDRDYEKERFSKNKIYESARYFEAKHNLCIWDPHTESWLDERTKEFEIASEKNVGSQHQPEQGERDCCAKREKKRILLFADRKGWALDHIAKQIVSHCSDVFDFTIGYFSDITEPWEMFLLGEKFDLIHFLWRGWPLNSYNTPGAANFAQRLNLDPERFYQQYIAQKKICVSVYDHFFLGEDFTPTTEALFSYEHTPVRAYSVSSAILKEIYDKDKRIRIKPDRVVTDGVDLELFHPIHIERMKKTRGQSLVLGWAGNSEWGEEHGDLKGLRTMIRPVVKQLQDEGYPVELKLCDRAEKWTPHEQMPDYYAGIDVYLCMSSIEGTPNPILECMACGVPFISTRVGIVPEAAGSLQSEFILRSRTTQELREKLLRLLAEPELLEQISMENIKSIQSWDWRLRVREFIPMWEKVLNTEI